MVTRTIRLTSRYLIPGRHITVRLINRKDLDFIVGWNVMKYLTPTYHPSTTSQLYQLELEEAGHQLFLKDRANNISNHMQSMFNYRLAKKEDDTKLQTMNN